MNFSKTIIAGSLLALFSASSQALVLNDRDPNLVPSTSDLQDLIDVSFDDDGNPAPSFETSLDAVTSQSGQALWEVSDLTANAYIVNIVGATAATTATTDVGYYDATSLTFIGGGISEADAIVINGGDPVFLGKTETVDTVGDFGIYNIKNNGALEFDYSLMPGGPKGDSVSFAVTDTTINIGGTGSLAFGPVFGFYWDTSSSTATTVIDLISGFPAGPTTTVTTSGVRVYTEDSKNGDEAAALTYLIPDATYIESTILDSTTAPGLSLVSDNDDWLLAFEDDGLAGADFFDALFVIKDIDPALIPSPSVIALFGLGLFGLGVAGRRKSKMKA